MSSRLSRSVPIFESLLVLLVVLASGVTASVAGGIGYSVSTVHTDHLGSMRLVTDRDGQIVSEHTYLPFGEEIGGVLESPSSHRFTGHERDLDTGLDYMLARYYSVSFRRFITIDPSVESIEPENPQTWNRYPYVLNNPLSLIDPDGLETKELTSEDIEKAAKEALADSEEGANPVDVANEALNSLGDFSASGADIAAGLEAAGVEIPDAAADALNSVDSVKIEGGELTVEMQGSFQLELKGPNVDVSSKVTAKISGSGNELAVTKMQGVKYGSALYGLGRVRSVEAKGGEGQRFDIKVKVGAARKTFTFGEKEE